MAVVGDNGPRRRYVRVGRRCRQFAYGIERPDDQGRVREVGRRYKRYPGCLELLPPGVRRRATCSVVFDFERQFACACDTGIPETSHWYRACRKLRTRSLEQVDVRALLAGGPEIH